MLRHEVQYSTQAAQTSPALLSSSEGMVGAVNHRRARMIKRNTTLQEK